MISHHLLQMFVWVCVCACVWCRNIGCDLRLRGDMQALCEKNDMRPGEYVSAELVLRWEYSQWWINSSSTVAAVHVLSSTSTYCWIKAKWCEFSSDGKTSEERWAMHLTPYFEQLWLIMAPRSVSYAGLLRALNWFLALGIAPFHAGTFYSRLQTSEVGLPRPCAVGI